ncbi:optic atrophy 3-like protein [Atractiella rhizophila]|nr:optic atrophy 3-like protein [Atractiella rhizophila]
MASTKIVSLVIRTLSKPISNRLKTQAQEHPWFRERVLSLAQFMHRSEMRMRTGLLRDPLEANVPIRPLNEAKAIQNGANFISESFLFAVALALILGESYRGYRKDTNRRNYVDEQLDNLSGQIAELNNRIHSTNQELLERLKETEASRDLFLGREDEY